MINQHDIPIKKQIARFNINRKKKVLVFLWINWERMFNRLFRIQPIDRNNPLLMVRVRTYWGKTIQLLDGEKIQRGDRILEIHFNNEMLFNMGIHARSSFQLAIQMIRSAEKLLPKTLPIILKHPDSEKIKALYGISMIYQGTNQFGFTVNNVPKGPFSFFTKVYLRLLLCIVHPQGYERLQNKTGQFVPRMMIMTKKELIRRYSIENL
ncbi:hypothetical protein H5P36_04865 [Bacillus sp. APMAM]|nr:hypothetical protein [Bacillus sp. APMAM]RTZ57359.1 hypothetical protein EKO25_02100 [Bacillus sp. SAJ1]